MRRSYTFTTPIRNAEDFAERLLCVEGTLVSDDPIPYPPDHHILLNLDDANSIRIRHYASPTAVASPILQLDFEDVAHGSVLHCEVLDADAPFSAAGRESEAKLVALVEPDSVPLAWLWLWLWRWLENRFIRPAQHRRGMEVYGKKLVGVVKEIAEENGIAGMGSVS